MLIKVQTQIYSTPAVKGLNNKNEKNTLRIVPQREYKYTLSLNMLNDV